MNRSSILHFRFGGGWSFFVIMGLCAIAGCPPADSSTADRKPVATRPSYVYPDTPPVVDRQSLQAFLVRLGGDLTVIWVIGDIADEGGATAATLAEARDELKAHNCPIIALYTGPAHQWWPQVVPMLQAAGANYPCAVVAPPAFSGTAAWLAGDVRHRQPGIYVVDRLERVVGRFGAQPEDVRAMVGQVAGGELLKNLQHQTMLCVRLRLIQLAGGEITASAVSNAADVNTLAQDLARQLTASKPPGTVAMLPFRNIGEPTPAEQEQNQMICEKLRERLEAHGWASLVSAEAAARVLAEQNLTSVAIEFDPSRLTPHVTWYGVLVGSVEHQALIRK